MKLYHKIETLWRFDRETKKHISGVFYNPNVELLKDNQWEFTEKIDGMNFRIVWDGHKLTYGGRTENTQFSGKQIKFIQEHLVNEEQEILFEQMFKDKVVIVFGELHGNKIQKGGELYTNNQGLAFKVFDIEIDDIFLTRESVIDITNNLNYDIVPVVLVGNIQEGIDFVNNNQTSTFSEAELEGLIGKPIGDFRDRLGKRIIIKIKRRDL